MEKKNMAMGMRVLPVLSIVQFYAFSARFRLLSWMLDRLTSTTPIMNCSFKTGTPWGRISLLDMQQTQVQSTLSLPSNILVLFIVYSNTIFILPSFYITSGVNCSLSTIFLNTWNSGTYFNYSNLFRFVVFNWK